MQLGVNRAQSRDHVISLAGSIFAKLAMLLPCCSSTYCNATERSATSGESGDSLCSSRDSRSFRANREWKKRAGSDWMCDENVSKAWKSESRGPKKRAFVSLKMKDVELNERPWLICSA